MNRNDVILFLVLLMFFLVIRPPIALADEVSVDLPELLSEELELPLCIPERIIIDSLSLDQPIDPCDDNDIINPNSWWAVVWWTGGGCPSSTPKNSENLTTYLFGHASNNLSRKVVFDDLKHMESGDNIRIITNVGSFTYAVEEVFVLEKSAFLEDERVTLNREGRLLLVSCWTKEKYNRRVAKHNIVVVANLESFTP